MDHSIKFVTSWLKEGPSHTTHILTISGIGGIGKTSLAKYVFGLHCHEFKRRSFIEDISRRCANHNGLLDVQKQLCHDITKTSSIQVLDDIDSLVQLNALLGNKVFHPGSKIIITTKDASLTESCALFHMKLKPQHVKHELKGLYEKESLELLCHHAFSCNNPNEGYEEVSKKLVKYCDGHPLALEILGSSLRTKDATFWEGFIEGLKKELLPDLRVKKALQMSFDSLPSQNDKDLFKHISCFFVGMDRDISETILSSCDLNTTTGITHLFDRSLLHIEWNNKLMMHSLIQEMGKDVVRQESPDHPEKRTRLWCHEDSFKVLKKKKGTDNIKGLFLDMRMLEKQKLPFELKTDALNNMDNLMILQLNYVQLSGSYENFPEDLRWLCLHGFPLKSIPSDLPMENLAVLDMSYSYIESFDLSYSNPQPLGKRQNQLIGSCSKTKPLLESLKILDLSFCEQLRSLYGFCEFPALEKLIVRNCTSLVEVCESVEQCGELVHVDLSYCNEFRNVAKTIAKLKSVKTLLLVGCNLGELSFNTNNIDRNSQTSSTAIVEAIPRYLKSLAISFLRSLVSLSLKDNNVSNESFPMDFSSLSMLKELYLDGNPIVSMPNCVRRLPRLELLSMTDCGMLMSIDQPPPTLTELRFGYEVRYDYPLLRKIVFDPEMPPLKLNVNFALLQTRCLSVHIEGIVKIQRGVEETLLHSLGWSNLDFIKKRPEMGPNESQIQMHYEFGIFSTGIYGCEVMPNWIWLRNKGPSISFIIPSSCNKLRGLNFCYVQRLKDEFPVIRSIGLPWIKISNITKDNTWIYNQFCNHYFKWVGVDGKCLTYLSHWMFRMNEMEAGDQVTVTVKDYSEQQENYNITSGVSFVYDDGDSKEEDVLGYYKSWNHIIGGDLSPFQITTGEYCLELNRFSSFPFAINPFIDFPACYYKEPIMYFKALSQRKSNIRGRAIEDVTK